MTLNWRFLTAVALTAVMWGGLAEGAFRVTHHGRPGLRHALYAHAVKAVHRVRALV